MRGARPAGGRTNAQALGALPGGLCPDPRPREGRGLVRGAAAGQWQALESPSRLHCPALVSSDRDSLGDLGRVARLSGPQFPHLLGEGVARDALVGIRWGCVGADRTGEHSAPWLRTLTLMHLPSKHILSAYCMPGSTVP